jgi:hypothetical protein
LESLRFRHLFAHAKCRRQQTGRSRKKHDVSHAPKKTHTLPEADAAQQQRTGQDREQTDDSGEETKSRPSVPARFSELTASEVAPKLVAAIKKTVQAEIKNTICPKRKFDLRPTSSKQKNATEIPTIPPNARYVRVRYSRTECAANRSSRKATGILIITPSPRLVRRSLDRAEEESFRDPRDNQGEIRPKRDFTLSAIL